MITCSYNAAFNAWGFLKKSYQLKLFKVSDGVAESMNSL